MNQPCIVCLFPGQGVQGPELGRQLETFVDFSELLTAFSDATELPLRRWLYESSAEELVSTAIAQPLIYFYSWVAFSAFAKHLPYLEEPVFAGHSLGEYTALAAAGVLDPIVTCRVLHERGKLMQAACPARFGGMAVVWAGNHDVVERACATVSDVYGESNALVIANYNSAKQVVVSGRLECIHMLKHQYPALGLTRVAMLPVSAPFHSPYLSAVPAAFAPICSGAIRKHFSPSSGWIIPNVTGNPVRLSDLTSQQILQLLLAQIDHPVQWERTTEHLRQWRRGLLILEFGPKPVLGPLKQRCESSGTVHSIRCQADVDKVRQMIFMETPHEQMF